jgi:glycolate oxidase FAD binding subunit
MYITAGCRTRNWNGSEHPCLMNMNRRDVLQETVRHAAASDTPLAVHGSGSKAFYGRPVSGEPLPVCEHRGVIDYAPSELVVTARAGTPLAELEARLAQAGQMLAFEPPHFGDRATLGGAIACGLSGPRRPYAGAARDFVLGITCINGRGEYLRFGGQVMKNVAGYDLSRTLTGSHGTLAVLLDISLKVLPRPEAEITLSRSCSQPDAIRLFNQWAGQPLPLSGGCHLDGQLYLRLAGTGEGVRAAAMRIGADEIDESASLWRELREQRLGFFSGDTPLWRLSLPPATPPLEIGGPTLLDWGGAQRWLRSGLPAGSIRAAVAAYGGHATLFRGGERNADIFQPLPAPLLAVHRRLKRAFDPEGILNPGRMYATL